MNKLSQCRPKLIRTCTVSVSLNILLKGQLRFLSQYFNVIGIASPELGLDEVRRREGVQTINIPMERGISPLKDFISLFRLYLRFKREKALIVHSITPKAGLLSMLAAKMAGVPIRMHTFTGLIFPSKKGLMQKLLIRMDKLLCVCATNIYPEGEGVRKDLIKYGVTHKPLKVIANGNVNGIDIEFFDKNNIDERLINSLKSKLKIQSNDFVFIFVGRLVKDKGINELVYTFKHLSGTENCKLLLVGDYEHKLDPLDSITIEEINRNPNIISVGFQKDVRPYFAVANALTFPSYREGFPNVVMQAGAMGLPCIVTDINGCNEIIIEGENGVIIPVKNIEALKRAMEKMINDKSYYEKLKENARSMIVSRYEQSVVWNALLTEYQQLLSSSRNV